MAPFNLGIIGAGMWGKVLAHRFQQDPRAKVTWINSASQATTQAAALQAGIEHWTLDYREVLADPAVDAVAIATPPYLHATQLLDALAAGKHVLIEKPLAESRQSMDVIAQAVRQYPHLIVLDASARHTRLTPKFHFIKEIIDSGKLGQVYHIHHNHLARHTFIEYNPNGAWAMDKKLAGGGPFIDWGVYDLSFHLGLLNDTPQLTSLHSFTRRDLRPTAHLVEHSDIEQHGAAWLEFTGGLTYYYERGGGVHAETPNETRLYGTLGGLRFQFPSWDASEIEFFSCENGNPTSQVLTLPPGPPPDDALALTTHFLDCLEAKAQPLMPISLACKHLDILFQVLSA